MRYLSRAVSLSACAEYDFIPASTLVCLNVGGHLVELPAELLCRDPASALAALCRKSPPVQPSPDGAVFYIDRDGWIFRHVINYLKNDVLPSDAETLKELYREATFFHLRSLQSAIESLPVSQILVGAAIGGVGAGGGPALRA
jgi:hypothetical protein